RADGDDAELGLEHVARAGDDERMLAVGNGEHRFQPAQDAIGAPVLGELDRRAHEVSLVLVELRLEALEERERVRRAAGEAREDLVVMQAPHLLCAALDDHLAERHLPVAAERDARAAAHGKDDSAVEFHCHGVETAYVEAGARKIKPMATPTATSAQTIIAPDGRSVTTESSSPRA